MKQCMALLILAAGLAVAPARADEGMWTFNDFPADLVKSRYGFEPSPKWLEHLRLSSVRLLGGCSGSVVSADGLVMTNRHCARQCIEILSGERKKDYNRDGFYAKEAGDEPRCADMELNQLTDITNVTDTLLAATRGVAPEKFHDAQKAVTSDIERRCATSDQLRCDVVTLWRGGRYELYRYRRLQDIRLVFAPEQAIADFGGDPDNFMFPRYDLDVAFVRIYAADGKPMKMAHHLAWSDGSIRDGDLTFVSGHPGGTSREFTVAQLADDRDVLLPALMNRISELRGFITQYQERGEEQRRHSGELLDDHENGLKSLKGHHAALADQAFYEGLVKREDDFRGRVTANPELAKRYGSVWDRIAQLVQRRQRYRKQYEALERGPISGLFEMARKLVRYAAESGKPDSERLKEFTKARFPQLKQELLSEQPVYNELEIATLGWSLAKVREDLGPDHPLVKRIFASRTAMEIARAAVLGSRLADIRVDAAGNAVGGFRKELFDGGTERIDASRDSMLELARAFDADARAIRAQVESSVDGPLKQEQERLAQARLAVYGNSNYPDATFTLRLSYGAVRGYLENGASVRPFTDIAGAFERHTGAEPFALPASWMAAKSRLNAGTPFNFVTSNDIVGGNSGSPVVNQKAEIVGLVFDGNIQSLGGEYGFNEPVNRAIAVHSGVLLEALAKVYGASRLVDEITAAK